MSERLDRMVTLLVTKTQQRRLKSAARKSHSTQQSLMREALSIVLSRYETNSRAANAPGAK